MTTTRTETPAIKTLYDVLAPYRRDGKSVWVVNNTDGFRFLSVATASTGGDAGGPRRTTVTPERLLPGLNLVPAAYWDRVEADADRQRKRTGGGVLSAQLDSGDIERVKDIDKAPAAKVDGWLGMSSDLQVIGDLRSHKTHGPAARKHFEAWHSLEASEQVKRNRYFWAASTNSRKVA